MQNSVGQVECFFFLTGQTLSTNGDCYAHVIFSYIQEGVMTMLLTQQHIQVTCTKPFRKEV